MTRPVCKCCGDTIGDGHAEVSRTMLLKERQCLECYVEVHFGQVVAACLAYLPPRSGRLPGVSDRQYHGGQFNRGEW